MTTLEASPTELPTLDDFRAASRSWLATAARPTARPTASVWGEGDESVAVFHDATGDAEAARLRAAIEWQRQRAAAGFVGISIPVAYGGRGLDPTFEQAYLDEESGYDVPAMPEVLGVTVRLAAPTIARWGTEEQKARFIPHLLQADLICCQLFSEPGAGSDLAGAACRADRVGHGWVLNGQKVWTSGAQLADVGVALCRTDATAPKHAGMTAFVVPMHAAGVEVRPIRQMSGGAAFNEVFLTDVRVDDADRLGEVGTGWRVALTMLGFERLVAGTAMRGIGGSFERLAGLARSLGRCSEPVTRQELARCYTGARLQQLTMDRLSADGSAKGFEGSIGKLLWTQSLTAIAEVAAELLGPRLIADTGEWGTYCWTEHLLGAPGYRIAGGSDEIQHNILGERLLGLPPEPRP